MVSFLTRLHIIQSFHLINVFEIDFKCMLTTLCVTTVKTNLIEIIQNLSISLTIYVIIIVWINFHLTLYFHPIHSSNSHDVIRCHPSRCWQDHL